MTKLLFFKTFVQVRWLEKWRSRQKIDSHQQKLLRQYKNYMRQHSPYFSKHGFVPDFIMDKSFMIEYFEQLNTVGVPKEKALAVARESEKTRDFTPTYKGISVGLSSGTSGHYGIFLTSPYEQTLWAATILAKMLPKWHLFGHRIAFFLRSDNNLYQSVTSSFLTLQYFDMKLEIEEHIAPLNQQQPTILIAPPSVLNQLAHAKCEEKLLIRPEKIISVAEILEDNDRQFIEMVFDQQIHQIYQATEGFLGATCQEGNLHLNEEALIFEKEWIDTKRFYPIITDLKRRSQPFYRYRLNDILQLDPNPCHCGNASMVIKKIEGRSDDIFYLMQRNSLGLKEIYPDFIRRVLLMVNGLEQYRVKQTGYQKLEIELSPRNDDLETAIKEGFEQFTDDFGLSELSLIFVDYKREKNKKLRRIVRLVDINNKN